MAHSSLALCNFANGTPRRRWRHWSGRSWSNSFGSEPNTMLTGAPYIVKIMNYEKN